MSTSSTPTPPKLRGYGAHILYLDFDGVLHPEDVWRKPGVGIYLGPGGDGHQLFENLPLLEGALAPYPWVQIVLSTTWVRILRFSKAKAHLTEQLQSRVIGGTFHTGMDDAAYLDLPRGQQVERDAARRKPAEWVAVDDAHEGWSSEAKTRVVLTDPVEGIRHPEVFARLQSTLAAKFSNPPH